MKTLSAMTLIILSITACSGKRGSGARGLGPSPNFGALSARGELKPEQVPSAMMMLMLVEPNLPHDEDWNGKHEADSEEIQQKTAPRSFTTLLSRIVPRSKSSLKALDFNKDCEKTISGSDTDSDRDGITDSRRRQIDCTDSLNDEWEESSTQQKGIYQEQDYDPANPRSGGRLVLESFSLNGHSREKKKREEEEADRPLSEYSHSVTAQGEYSLRGSGQTLKEILAFGYSGITKQNDLSQDFAVAINLHRDVQLFSESSPAQGGKVSFSGVMDLKGDVFSQIGSPMDSLDVGLQVDGRDLIYAQAHCAESSTWPEFIAGTITAKDGAGHVLSITYRQCKEADITLDGKPLGNE